mgnify:CR=1 FL=1
MKFYMPSDQFDLYKEGFGSRDVLHRKEIGIQLSKLVEAISDPLVIAVDGSWGSGKTFFLKSWVGAHELENSGKALTIYVDAFRHEYLDDPLTSLILEFEQRTELIPQPTTVGKIRNAVVRMAGPVARIGVAIGSAGLAEIAGPVVNAAVTAAKDEANDIENYQWRLQRDRMNALEDFRGALEGYTKNVKKLVFVVDELDRCRPDFALSLLEVSKHLFSVSGVHFVIGVNLQELRNSVHSRYGPETNANAYLQKFISITTTLPDEFKGSTTTRAALLYLKEISNKMDFPPNSFERLEYFCKGMGEELTLRSIDKIATHLSILLASNRLTNLVPAYEYGIYGILILRAVFPEQFALLKKQLLSLETIETLFGFSGTNNTHRDLLLTDVWLYLLGKEVQPNSSHSWLFGPFGTDGQHDALESIFDKYFTLFSPSETAF